MTDSQLVSVLMPCYRESVKDFTEALRSILEQTYRRIEVVVVFDDPDNNALYDIAQNASSQDSRICLVRNERNLGLSNSLEKAFRVSHGQYICRMDSDDISEVQRIERQMAYLEEHKLDLVGSYLTAIDEDDNQLYLVDSIPTSGEGVKRSLMIRNCVPHPSWFGRRSVFEIGYRPVPLAEDYDLLLRAELEGFSIGNVPEPLIRYRMTANSISRSNLYKQYLVSQCLREAFEEGRSLDIDRVDVLVGERFDQRRAEYYLKANALFNNGMRSIHAGNRVEGFSQLLQIPFCSMSYFMNVVNMVRVVAIKTFEKSSY